MSTGDSTNMSKPASENDPETYQESAGRVTAESDRDVWVVQEKIGGGWRVAAVLTSYDDAQAYMADLRDFSENCPEDAPEEYCRRNIEFRYGSRDSPTKMFEEWPPDTEEDKDD